MQRKEIWTILNTVIEMTALESKLETKKQMNQQKPG